MASCLGAIGSIRNKANILVVCARTTFATSVQRQNFLQYEMRFITFGYQKYARNVRTTKQPVFHINFRYLGGRFAPGADAQHRLVSGQHYGEALLNAVQPKASVASLVCWYHS
ncbi:MAG: hypothetical protein ACJASY_003471 [Halioglobus sp.]|jgi:hypothetical protein